jgi:hypothetical protein
MASISRNRAATALRKIFIGAPAADLGRVYAG